MRLLRWMVIAIAFIFLFGATAYIFSPSVRALSGQIVTSYRQGQLQERFAAVWQRWSLALKEKLRSPSNDFAYWQVESRAEREALPLYKIIPAEDPARLTPAAPWPIPEAYVQWHRSHGDAASSRYSDLADINRDNVGDLNVAWTFRPGTGDRNIQSTPVIADGLLYTPTVGHDIVALNAETGEEVWHFDPGSSFRQKEDSSGGKATLVSRRASTFLPEASSERLMPQTESPLSPSATTERSIAVHQAKSRQPSSAISWCTPR